VEKFIELEESYNDLICTDNNIWYGKCKRKGKKRFFVFFLIVAILIIIFLSYKNLVVNQIISIAKSQINLYVTTSVNNAVLQSLETNIDYYDIVTVSKDNQGNITLMSIDNVKTNTINRKISLISQQKLKEYENKGIPIPIGTFLGIPIFSGIGKEINLKILAVGNVVCDFVSNFVSVGVNQTLHSLYVKVTSTINLDIPLSYSKITSETSVLLCEAVLVGKVPEIYINK
jgi:sporulation protein YunB